MWKAWVTAVALLLATGASAQEKQREILLADSTPQGAKRRILFFTKSSGFEHSVIKKPDEKPSHAEKVLLELAGMNHWEVVHTKDGGIFTAENLAKFDAFFFYTTGDLTTPGKDNGKPMTPEGKGAFLEAIKNGKGFIGSHSATDTFHSPGSRFAEAGEKMDPYIQMIGGEFIRHGKQQTTRMTLASPRFPGAEGIQGGGFDMMEEWYSFKDYQKDIHVVLVSETEKMAKSAGDSVYNRPPYPATWARMHGKGRVFYTSMGHREDVWTNPIFQNLLTGGIKWALKEVEADVTPNVEKAAPGYRVIPPEK